MAKGKTTSKKKAPTIQELEARVKELEERVPNTQLLDQSFWKRSLAIYGHYFAINMIIGAAIFIFMMVFSIIPIILLGVIGANQ